MTFDEAIEKKKEYGDLYTNEKKGCVDFGVLITPKNDKDLETYFKDRYENANSFNPITIIDIDAKKYSTDGKFSIYAIKVIESVLLKTKLS
jgi:hypothetical protein